MSDFESYLPVALRIAADGSKKMGQMFLLRPDQLRTQFKSDDGDTPVTVIDKVVGEQILGRLTGAFPTHDVWGEDASMRVQQGSEFEWNFDPLDGTRNTLFGLQQFVVGINLNHEGKCVLSVVANPFEQTLTYATKGDGAFVSKPDGNDARRLRVDVGKPWNQRLVLLDSNLNQKTWPAKFNALAVLAKRGMNLGSFGSNLLHWSLVAQGRAHCVLTDTVGGFWDIAAHLTVTEAGGKAIDVRTGAEPMPGCLVAFGSTGEGHDEVVVELAELYKEYRGFR